MKVFVRVALIVVSLIITMDSVQARAFSQDSKEGTGSIAGRVTIDGKAALGMIVSAYPVNTNSVARESNPVKRSSTTKTTTDGEGAYHLSGLPAGKYNIFVHAPAFIGATEGYSSSHYREVALGEGETINKIDFALARGGVITGRVTDAEGQPVIGERIKLKRVDNAETNQYVDFVDTQTLLTDDRGIYRIYGLRPGRYIVSAGSGEEMPGLALLFNRRNTSRTYYPGVADETGALAVEVTMGSEATNVDIKFSQPKKSYKVSGRVLDSETGMPVPNAFVAFIMKKEGQGRDGFPKGFSSANSKGEFQFDSVLPGRYEIAAGFLEQSEYYEEKSDFEVNNSDVTKLDLKLHRGVSMSGTVIVENTSDPDIIAQLSGTNISAYVTNPDEERSGGAMGKIEADGSFRISGLRPGKARISLESSWDLRQLRVERDGIAQPDGIEVRPAEHISGVRVILAYIVGIVRGRVVIQGGELPPNTHLKVVARQVDSVDGEGESSGEVDTRGNFVIENLPPGNYELELKAYSRSTYEDVKLPPVKHIVAVTNETEAEVTLILDLKSKGRDR